MRLLDLFSGIGGFSLAAEWVWGDELEIVGFCEIEKYCQKVLQKNFPGVPIYEDITKLNGKDFKDIDLLTGGFPCQDISIAGKGAGIEGSRSGLWFEMWRIISEIRPRFALIENVPMLTIRGGTRVISDLAEIGYDAEWQVIGADDVGAWHRRKRIWIVAYPGNGSDSAIKGQKKEKNRISKEHRQKRRSRMSARTSINGEISSEVAPDTDSFRCKLRRTETRPRETDIARSSTRQEFISTRCESYWAVEPDVGRVANGIPSRVDRLKGLGNAIVPQVAALIMKRIKNETKTGR